MWKRAEDVPSYLCVATLGGHQDSLGLGVSALCFLPPGALSGPNTDGLLVRTSPFVFWVLFFFSSLGWACQPC